MLSACSRLRADVRRLFGDRGRSRGRAGCCAARRASRGHYVVSQSKSIAHADSIEGYTE